MKVENRFHRFSSQFLEQDQNEFSQSFLGEFFWMFLMEYKGKWIDDSGIQSIKV